MLLHTSKPRILHCIENHAIHFPKKMEEPVQNLPGQVKSFLSSSRASESKSHTCQLMFSVHFLGNSENSKLLLILKSPNQAMDVILMFFHLTNSYQTTLVKKKEKRSKEVLLVCVCVSCSAVPASLRPHRVLPTRLLHPWDFPGKNTGVGWCFLLQGVFLTQISNLGLLHRRQTFY